MRVPDLTGGGWAALACPVCGADLGRVAEKVFGCSNGHRFDLARQGYLALLGNGSRLDTGDSAAMVQAREEFLERGLYVPIAAAVRDALTHVPAAGPVLEVGAGTGYYLRAVLDARGFDATGVALDASKFAARRAATDPRITSVLADAWSVWPIRSRSVGTVLTVFAPRNVAETRRVLRPDGTVVIVVPNPEHQQELRGPLGLLAVDSGKPDRLIEAFGPPIERVSVQVTQLWSAADITAAAAMSPSAHHLTPGVLAERVSGLGAPVPVTVSVTVQVFRP